MDAVTSALKSEQLVHELRYREVYPLRQEIPCRLSCMARIFLVVNIDRSIIFLVQLHVFFIFHVVVCAMFDTIITVIGLVILDVVRFTYKWASRGPVPIIVLVP